MWALDVMKACLPNACELQIVLTPRQKFQRAIADNFNMISGFSILHFTYRIPRAIFNIWVDLPQAC